MLIVAERINSSRTSISQAIESEDVDFIQKEARTQAEKGADYIDVNAGTFLGEEMERLKWAVEVVQEVTDVPLCIDSADPEVIKAVLPVVKQTPMINSITLETTRLEGILPLVVDEKAKIIGLCQSEETMAETTEDKLLMAGRLVARVSKAGIPLDDLYIDPLVYPLATNPQSAIATLDAIEQIMKEFPGVHTICGLTNVSYGMPNRKLINRTFLVSAIIRGLDSVILDPTDKKLFSALKTADMVAGNDDFCMQYIAAFREGRLES
jgi:5-methyltetrahydrofolate--homocysteine methyltransferase